MQPAPSELNSETVILSCRQQYISMLWINLREKIYRTPLSECLPEATKILVEMRHGFSIYPFVGRLNAFFQSVAHHFCEFSLEPSAHAKRLCLDWSLSHWARQCILQWLESYQLSRKSSIGSEDPKTEWLPLVIGRQWELVEESQCVHTSGFILAF